MPRSACKSLLGMRSLSSHPPSITWRNIVVKNVPFPIYVTQNYWDQGVGPKPNSTSTSNTLVADFTFENFSGTLRELVLATLRYHFSDAAAARRMSRDHASRTRAGTSSRARPGTRRSSLTCTPAPRRTSRRRTSTYAPRRASSPKSCAIPRRCGIQTTSEVVLIVSLRSRAVRASSAGTAHTFPSDCRHFRRVQVVYSVSGNAGHVCSFLEATQTAGTAPLC